jgi:hypothetical protein
MAMLIEDEEIRLDSSWVAYIPVGIRHMPIRVPGGKITNKPVCHWTSGPGGVYNREKDEKAAETGIKKAEPKTARTKTSERKTGEVKNTNNIVYGYKPDTKKPVYMRQTDPEYTRPVAYIDEKVIPGAEFGCDTMWFLPGEKSKAGQLIMDKHSLSHGTSLTITAMNYADITDLCAEVELWIGGEKHIINKSFGAYIPPDVEQGPLIVRNVKSQIFFMMSQPVGEGIKKYRGR